MRVFGNKEVREKNEARTTDRTVAYNQSVVERLVDKASAGNFEAFGKLYGSYLDQIYRYVFYQVKDKMTAEDITEEVFVKAWKAIGSCKGKGKTFSAWLYRIAHNHMINTLRSMQKCVSIEQGNMAEFHDSGLEIEKRLEHQELLELVACLPENQRQVIILKFITGQNNHDIARIMDKREGAIRILQMRALTALRQRLGSEGSEQV
jgi:RNA polymerase sigma-70 factor, ECF subfamily